jgi:hypothetical protein
VAGSADFSAVPSLNVARQKLALHFFRRWMRIANDEKWDFAAILERIASGSNCRKPMFNARLADNPQG